MGKEWQFPTSDPSNRSLQLRRAPHMARLGMGLLKKIKQLICILFSASQQQKIKEFYSLNTAGNEQSETNDDKSFNSIQNIVNTTKVTFNKR